MTIQVETRPSAAADVHGGVTPYINVDGALKAAEYYRRAFGGREVGRAGPDPKGRMMHVHLVINGGSLMLCDPFPEHGHPFEVPQGYFLHLQVDDVDAWWARAIEAGVEVTTPLERMFWGDRWGQIRDPFGVTWSIGAPAAS